MLNRLPADERRTQLVESALALAEQGGVGAVTVRAVAEKAGVSLGVVHYCFENKEALVVAMAETLIDQLGEAMNAAFDIPDDVPGPEGLGGLRQLLHAGLTATWPALEFTAGRQLLTYEITAYSLRHRPAGIAPTGAGSPVASGDIAALQYQRMDDHAGRFLLACADRSGTEWIEPVPSLARLALALLDGLVLRWLVDQDDDAVTIELDNLAEIIASRAIERP
ncbi:TetR/AcrR family transcriptional regulator [Rhodococcus sp. BL-253-APC-6A1W]|uniref:TetR/AcrR family transcriptional regulator n=1 Tax=Rhodococcus sp. BL-253-APC-6A1W TaxID=2725307 RepID=UPI00146BF058|nr:TetR/AcrR family transcriptional regulator [Rhodococcus sp. BL-253-APC-6A1W]NMD96425.1 TetR/AcrR family transcriptional regulator [Rhodococcus sp. BL-253-APC-6A1W]